MDGAIGWRRRLLCYGTVVGLAGCWLALAVVPSSVGSHERPGARRIVKLPVNGAPRAHSSVISTWRDAAYQEEDGAVLSKGCLTATYYVAAVRAASARRAADSALSQVEGTTLSGWQPGWLRGMAVATDAEHATVTAARPLARASFAVLVVKWRGCVSESAVGEVARSIGSFEARAN